MGGSRVRNGITTKVTTVYFKATELKLAVKINDKISYRRLIL